MALKIGIYIEPAGTGIGGAENVAAVLAEALAQEHRVEIAHRIPSLSAGRLAEDSGTNLDGVSTRYVEPGRGPATLSPNPLRRYRASRDQQAELSAPYDVFVAIVHDIPPFCHAARGALIVLFPGPTPYYFEPEGGVSARRALGRPAGYLYHGWEWRRRMSGYQLKTAISEFSRRWARRRWRIDCEVVFPPVDTCFRRVEKEPVILSAGRFALKWEGHTKKQGEMLGAFRELEGEGLRGWEYFCVGGLRDTPEHHAFFGRLRDSAAGSRAHLIANIERAGLKRLFERAGIFWHAAGYGEDEATQPVRVEHFGISTVEAMAAGCVPVVINKGGQREIVQHGVNGFLWETLDELKGYTRLVAGDARLRARMSEAARERARLFSREAFVEKFLRLMGLRGADGAAAGLRPAAGAAGLES